MAVYTKKGDKGETSTLENESISKDSKKIHAIGTLDEANSYLGVARANIADADVQRIILSFQTDLFITASILSGSNLSFNSKKTKVMELLIDKLEGYLPVLKNFVITGDSPESAHLMYARTIVRRAERTIIALDRLDGF